MLNRLAWRIRMTMRVWGWRTTPAKESVGWRNATPEMRSKLTAEYHAFGDECRRLAAGRKEA